VGVGWWASKCQKLFVHRRLHADPGFHHPNVRKRHELQHNLSSVMGHDCRADDDSPCDRGPATVSFEVRQATIGPMRQLASGKAVSRNDPAAHVARRLAYVRVLASWCSTAHTPA
jgi:hypothetical protein